MKTPASILLLISLTMLTGCQSWMGSVTPKKQPVALVAIPPQPPMPPGAESYNVIAQPSVRATAAVVLPLIPDKRLMWDYLVTLPAPNLVFEVWRTADVAQAFSLFAVTNQPPVWITPGFYICRGKNTTTGEYSDWNKP